MAELKGILLVKKDTEMVTESFRKREFVIQTIEQYPQKIPMQLANDKVSLIDNVNLNQEITVSFNYRGSEYKKEGQETKYFLNLDAWKITT